MMIEAELFLDRAITLFLIRYRLRKVQMSTWADIGVYYSNFFAASSVSRLALSSVTFVGGDVFIVVPNAPTYFEFRISKNPSGASHRTTWDLYYDAVQNFGWPDLATVATLVPPVPDRHKERVIRQSINYTPGRGILEIHESAAKYQARISHLRRLSLASPPLDDSALLESQAYLRLKHGLDLSLEIQRGYLTTREIEARGQVRERLIRRYAADDHDARMLVASLT